MDKRLIYRCCGFCRDAPCWRSRFRGERPNLRRSGSPSSPGRPGGQPNRSTTAGERPPDRRRQSGTDRSRGYGSGSYLAFRPRARWFSELAGFGVQLCNLSDEEDPGSQCANPGGRVAVWFFYKSGEGYNIPSKVDYGAYRRVRTRSLTAALNRSASTTLADYGKQRRFDMTTDCVIRSTTTAFQQFDHARQRERDGCSRCAR